MLEFRVDRTIQTAHLLKEQLYFLSTGLYSDACLLNFSLYDRRASCTENNDPVLCCEEFISTRFSPHTNAERRMPVLCIKSSIAPQSCYIMVSSDARFPSRTLLWWCKVRLMQNILKKCYLISLRQLQLPFRSLIIYGFSGNKQHRLFQVLFRLKERACTLLHPSEEVF